MKTPCQVISRYAPTDYLLAVVVIWLRCSKVDGELQEPRRYCYCEPSDFFWSGIAETYYRNNKTEISCFKQKRIYGKG